MTDSPTARLEVVRLLLDGGADPGLAGSSGRTPLMTAARITGIVPFPVK